MFFHGFCANFIDFYKTNCKTKFTVESVILWVYAILRQIHPQKDTLRGNSILKQYEAKQLFTFPLTAYFKDDNSQFHLHNCLCLNVGVPKDRRDLTVEAAAKRVPSGCQPQAE